MWTPNVLQTLPDWKDLDPTFLLTLPEAERLKVLEHYASRDNTLKAKGSPEQHIEIDSVSVSHLKHNTKVEETTVVHVPPETPDFPSASQVSPSSSFT